MRNKIESGRLNAASYIVFRGLRISDHDDSKRFSHCNKQHLKKDNKSIPVDSNIIPPRAPDNCVVHFLNFSAVFKYRHLGAYSRFARHNRNEPPLESVSSGFTLFRHSSPSFGSQQTRSHSNLPKGRIGLPHPKGDRISPRRHGAAFTFIAPWSFAHPKTRAHLRLLGPCFKAGRMDPYDRQRPKRVVREHRPNDRQRPQSTASSPSQSTTGRKDGTPATRGMRCNFLGRT